MCGYSCSFSPRTNEGVCIPYEHSVTEPSWNRHIEDFYLPFPGQKDLLHASTCAVRSQNTAWYYPPQRPQGSGFLLLVAHHTPDLPILRQGAPALVPPSALPKR